MPNTIKVVREPEPQREARHFRAVREPTALERLRSEQAAERRSITQQ